MSELIAVGSSEWSDGVTRINAMRKSWREDVEEDYNRRLALWNARYALLQDSRSQWIEEATVTAVGASAESMGLDLEQSAESLIAGSEMLLIQEVIAEVPDLETVVSDTLNSPALTDMIAHAERLNTRARGPSVVAAYLPTMRTSGAAHELALQASSEIGEEVAARAALVTALQMADQVRMIEDGLVDGVADTNTQVESSVRTMMENSGYQLTGIRFRRKAIIDESLFGGVERETQYVSTYRHFIVPELELGVDLSRESLENRSARTIQASVTVAQKALEDYQTLIFGRDEDEDDDPFSHASAAFARQFEAAETAFKNSAGYNRVDDEDEYLHHDTDGLFNWHVGYAPTMQQKNPEKVDEAGYGEMGRIMEAFMINEARQQRGMANFDTPTYALKMWDDDKDNDGESDGFFGAPSIKDITNVAVSVAAYSLGAGPLVTAAINLVDDAVFTAADVATGFRKADEAWGSFGKQAAVSIASASVSGAFNGFGGNAGSGGLNNLVDGATKNATAFTATSIDIGLGAAQGFTTNAVSGAISSYDFSSGKFNSKSFQNSIVGESALAGYAGNAVQTGVRAGMTGFLSTDGTGVGLNGAVFNTAALHAMAGVGGSLAGAAIDYAIDGDATVNLVHTRMFGAKNSTGLLEMNLGGDGSLFNLGMGGYDVGVDQVYTALQGIGDITRVSAAKLGGALGTERGIRNRADLNLVNYNAIAGNLGLAVGVWNRDITTRYEDLEEDHYGYYNHGEDPTTIVMNDNLLTNDRETAAMLASVAAHEGTHLFDRLLSGSTTEANAHLVGRTVYNKLVAELELNGNTAFSQSIEDALADGRSYLPNQGPVDNWKLTENGDIVFDGERDLYDENGELLREFEGEGGYTAALAEHLGISEIEANDLMVAAGYHSFENRTFVTGDGTNVMNDERFAVDPGEQFAARYFLQRDYVDNVGAFGGSMVTAMNSAQESAEAEFITALRNGKMTPEVAAQYEAAYSMEAFAQEYDAALYGQRYGSFGAPGLLDRERNERYSQDDIAQAFSRIRDEWSLDNNNPMYALIGDGRAIDPIQGRDAISTFSRYRDGSEHGWGGGEAIDLRTFWENHPLYTTQEETLIVGSNPLGWDNPSDPSIGYGLNLRTRTPDFDMIYGHLHPNTYATNQLNDLLQAAQATDIYRFTLPPGYQFGNVGNTGNSTGPHLHWEFRPRW